MGPKIDVIEWSRRRYTAKQRILFLMIMGIIFLAIVPYILLLLSNIIDNLLGFPTFSCDLLTFILGTSLGIFGFLFGIWSVIVLFTGGKGTPAPFMATQRLVTDGPYSYCRNPMTFGIFTFYLGIGIVTGSFSYLGLVILLTILILMYTKHFEEGELEMRFGEEYLKYKRNTPFLVPRILWNKNQKILT